MTITAHNTSLATGEYTVDATHSRVGFVARHAMVTKVRGAFNELAAVARFDAENPAASSVSVTIQVASIDTRNAQRDGHLRSGDFFEAETYPLITFNSTEVAQVGADLLRVTGDLIIKGVSRSVTIDFSYEGSSQDPYGNQRVGFEGSVVVNRKDWGLSYNAALETGGLLISDKVTLEFELSAIKAA